MGMIDTGKWLWYGVLVWNLSYYYIISNDLHCSSFLIRAVKTKIYRSKVKSIKHVWWTEEMSRNRQPTHPVALWIQNIARKIQSKCSWEHDIDSQIRSWLNVALNLFCINCWWLWPLSVAEKVRLQVIFKVSVGFIVSDNSMFAIYILRSISWPVQFMKSNICTWWNSMPVMMPLC